MRYQPEVGSLLTVTLPGEIVRASVCKVVDRNTVLVALDATPMNPSKAHSYQRDDVVAVRRTAGELGEQWAAVDERELAARTGKRGR